MLIFNKPINLLIIFSVLIFFSCNKSSTEPFDENPIDNGKDTTAPIVSFTINEGYELSGEMSLFIDISDESDIDSTFLFLDNKTIGAYVGKVDTLTIDVTQYVQTIPGLEPLEKTYKFSEIIDNERSVEIKAVDSEGNIGRSGIKKVVITEYAGWRKFYKIDEPNINCILSDDNSLIWIGTNNGVIIYNPENGSTRQLTIPSTFDYPDNWINDIELIGGSSVWIASDHHACQYNYSSNNWVQVVVPPPAFSSGPDDGQYPHPQYIWSVTDDNNNNLYIGTDSNEMFKYDGSNFTVITTPGSGHFNMKMHPDGTLYYVLEHGDPGVVFNDIAQNISGVTQYSTGYSIIIDNSGSVWLGANGWNIAYGCFVYDGTNWSNYQTYDPTHLIKPILCSKKSTIYAEILEEFIHDTYGHPVNKNLGLATFDGINWNLWSNYDSPFSTYSNEIPEIQYDLKPLIDEAPNGDIWMVVGGTLMRYRPSLGGYP